MRKRLRNMVEISVCVFFSPREKTFAHIKYSVKEIDRGKEKSRFDFEKLLPDQYG